MTSGQHIHLTAEAADLARSLQRVQDFQTFVPWVRGPVRCILPHDTLVCALIATRSAGQTRMEAFSVDVPDTHAAEIITNTMRGPVYQRFVQQPETPFFFDAERDHGSVSPLWLDRFRQAGWFNALALGQTTRDVSGASFQTFVGFCNVGADTVRESRAMRDLLLPLFRVALTRLIFRNPPSPESPSAHIDLTPSEQAIVRGLRRALRNKEIAKELGKSDKTVKNQISTLLEKTGARNRIELVTMFENRSDFII